MQTAVNHLSSRISHTMSLVDTHPRLDYTLIGHAALAADTQSSSHLSVQAIARGLQTGVLNSGLLIEMLRESCELQSRRAVMARASSAQMVSGDAALRNTILTFLQPQAQRELFRYVASGSMAERLRAFFGPPPYSFLVKGEAVAFDAGSISRGRANMTYHASDVLRVPNYSQFGVASCVDDLGREFRLYQRPQQQSLAEELVEMGLDGVLRALDGVFGMAGSCELLCRVPRSLSSLRSASPVNPVAAPTDDDSMALAPRVAVAVPTQGTVIRLRSAPLFALTRAGASLETGATATKRDLLDRKRSRAEYERAAPIEELLLRVTDVRTNSARSSTAVVRVERAHGF